MKKYFIIPILLFISLMFYSCNDTTTNPETPTTGSVYITSVPAGAQIWLNGVNQIKVTPDSLKNLTAGSFQITLKLTGYKDTTFSVDVTANQTTNKNVVLTSNVSLVTYGPVRIWETVGTTSAQPSGLILSTGVASGVGASAANRTSVDIYYSSDGFLVRSADYYGSGLTRNTYFNVGSGTNLNDGIGSSPKDNTWGKSMSDRETHYVFLFDNDGHYSKIIITSYGGGTPGNPAYVEVQWIYNQTAGDTRF
jgi:hypothetical protein